MTTAKLYWSEGEQFLLLPEGFMLDAGEVRIRRQGRAIILEPVAEAIGIVPGKDPGSDLE